MLRILLRVTPPQVRRPFARPSAFTKSILKTVDWTHAQGATRLGPQIAPPSESSEFEAPVLADLPLPCGANMIDAISSQLGPESHFADRLKELRQRILGKQLCLSYALGCTDAAVSLWESGKRLPQEGTLWRVLLVLARSGASASELTKLHDSWQKASHTLRATGYARQSGAVT